MPCLITLLALAFPRVVLFFVWLLTDYLRVFESRIWLLLGFIFMPLTTLAYAWTINSHGRVEGMYLGLIILAALIDWGTIGGGAFGGGDNLPHDHV